MLPRQSYSDQAASSRPPKKDKVRKAKSDEVLPFFKVVGRCDANNKESELCLHGVAISRSDGGHNIYWSGKRNKMILFGNCSRGLDHFIDLDIIRLGWHKI